MSNNSDQNSRVSAEGGVPTTVETEAVLPEAEQGSEPASHLASLLKEAEDEAARLKDAWLRAKAETDNVRKQAQNGSWGGQSTDAFYGPNYATAMAVLSLTVEYRYLPIYQRGEEPARPK